MDPNEIVTGLTKIGEVAAGSIPFTAIVKAMLGDAANEVAQQLATEVKVYRYGRSLKLLEKAERMAKEAGFTPKAVPIKLLFPLLEGASLEEDESLHDMWAALLANAAHPQNTRIIRPTFWETLKHLSGEDARFLKGIYQSGLDRLEELYPQRLVEKGEIPYEVRHVSRVSLSNSMLTWAAIVEDPFYEGNGNMTEENRKQYRLTLETLLSQSLLEYQDGGLRFTMKGAEFMQLCDPPKS
jgi:hypothetical protein